MSYPIELNEAAFEFAKKMIKEGNYLLDQGDWHLENPDTEEQDQFIMEEGMEAYGLWHLGMRPEYGVDTKERYSFPYGNYKKVCRSGLMAAEERAKQYQYEAVRNAALELLEMMPDTPQLVETNLEEEREEKGRVYEPGELDEPSDF